MFHDSSIRYCILIVLVALTCMFCGCCPTTSLHPLSDPDNPKFDERLSGAWLLSDDHGRTYLHIGKGEGRFTEIRFVEHRSDGSLDTGAFKAFPSFIDGECFLNITSAEQTEESFDGYIFVMYGFIENDRLTLTIWDEQAIENAIRSGLLKGEITDQRNGGQGRESKVKVPCVRITDDSQSLVRFMMSYGKKKLFNNGLGTFERIRGNGAPRQRVQPEQADQRR
jgi:hypothetical protein